VTSYALTRRQDKANKMLGGKARHNLIVGGSRSGKTFLLVRAIITRALRAPATRHAIMRLRGNAVRSSIALDTLPKVMDVCFPMAHLVEHRQDGFFELPNGSQIWLGGLDDKQRVEKILGQEYATIYFNECSQIPYGSVLVALTRLAQVAPAIKQRAYYDLNPSGTGHWTYDLFMLGRHPGSRERLDRPEDYAQIAMNPLDNLVNLSEDYLESLRSLPERQRQRFYEGQYVSEIENALWSLDKLDACRVSPQDIPDMMRVVVAIDPSGAAGAEDYRSDEIGIVVAGIGTDNQAYILADRSLRASPTVWGRIAHDAYTEFAADLFVAEKNYGGAMVEAVLQTAMAFAPVKLVSATRGKAVRAEPIAALFDQGRVNLAGRFPEMEEQLSNFSSSGYLGSRSPDRADAMVWALTELMGDNPGGMAGIDFLRQSFFVEPKSASSPWDVNL